MVRRSTAIGLGMVLAVFVLLGVVVAAAGVGRGVLRYGLPLLLFTLVIPSAMVFTAARLRPWLRANQDTPRVRRLRAFFMNPWARAGLALLVLPMSMPLVLSLMPGSGSRLAVLITTAWQPVMWTGFAFLMLSVVRRGGGDVCSTCEYDLAGAPEGGYDVCPECGSNMRAPTAVAGGRRRVVYPMIAVGVVLVIAPFASISRLQRGSPVVVAMLPTGSLIKEITAAPRGFTMDEWAELNTRTLTQPQVERLFAGLLELRDERRYLAREAEGWLDAAAMSRRVPREAIERYYAGMLELWLAAPERARRGDPDPLRFGFGGDYRGNLSVPSHAVLQTWFVPEALLVGGQPAAMEHDPRAPIAGVSMNTTDQSRRGAPRDVVTASTNGPLARVDVSSVPADAVELRGTGWIYVVPHGSNIAGAVWRTRVDVRKTVRVER